MLGSEQWQALRARLHNTSRANLVLSPGTPEWETVVSKGVEHLKKKAKKMVASKLNSDKGAEHHSKKVKNGNPIVVAQYATGCCCRKCLKKYHGIDAAQALTAEEMTHIVEIIMAWITEQMHKKPQVVVDDVGTKGRLKHTKKKARRDEEEEAVSDDDDDVDAEVEAEFVIDGEDDDDEDDDGDEEILIVEDDGEDDGQDDSDDDEEDEEEDEMEEVVHAEDIDDDEVRVNEQPQKSHRMKRLTSFLIDAMAEGEGFRGDNFPDADDSDSDFDSHSSMCDDDVPRTPRRVPIQEHASPIVLRYNGSSGRRNANVLEGVSPYAAHRQNDNNRRGKKRAITHYLVLSSSL